MSVRDSKTIRVKNVFIEDCLDKIISSEEERGIKISYAIASQILRDRITRAGGIK